MERDADVVIDTKVDLSESQDRVYAPELDSQSVMQSEVPPWAETYDIAADNEGELVTMHSFHSYLMFANR